MNSDLRPGTTNYVPAHTTGVVDKKPFDAPPSPRVDATPFITSEVSPSATDDALPFTLSEALSSLDPRRPSTTGDFLLSRSSTQVCPAHISSVDPKKTEGGKVPLRVNGGASSLNVAETSLVIDGVASSPDPPKKKLELEERSCGRT